MRMRDSVTCRSLFFYVMWSVFHLVLMNFIPLLFTTSLACHPNSFITQNKDLVWFLESPH